MSWRRLSSSTVLWRGSTYPFYLLSLCDNRVLRVIKIHLSNFKTYSCGGFTSSDTPINLSTLSNGHLQMSARSHDWENNMVSQANQWSWRGINKKWSSHKCSQWERQVTEAWFPENIGLSKASIGYSVVFHRRCWISWGSCGCETKRLGSFTPFHCIADEHVRQNLFVFSHISREYLKYTLAISEHSSSFLMLPSQVIQVSTIIVTCYTTTLRYLQTEGLLDKLTTLWEYCKIIWQLRLCKNAVSWGFSCPRKCKRNRIQSRKFPPVFNQAHSNPHFPSLRPTPLTLSWGPVLCSHCWCLLCWRILHLLVLSWLFHIFYLSSAVAQTEAASM